MTGILERGGRTALNSSSGEPAASDLLAPLRERPERSAILCDVDGTLAPIVAEPDRALVPAPTRQVLTVLSRRFALVACVSGRRAEDARRVVGIGSLAYIGNHGLERLAPGGERVEASAAAAGFEDQVRALAESLYTPALRNAGVRLEDKGPIRAFHWREASHAGAAEDAMEQIARRAQESGLAVHWGRKVLELRPPVHFDKGTAVTAALEDAAVESALYGGDDATDVDAFRALRTLREQGRLEHAACIGVRSDEAPAAVLEEADGLVDGPAGFRELLERLAA
jgi:trehalose 6-phosphate phosphatase